MENAPVKLARGHRQVLGDNFNTPKPGPVGQDDMAVTVDGGPAQRLDVELLAESGLNAGCVEAGRGWQPDNTDILHGRTEEKLNKPDNSAGWKFQQADLDRSAIGVGEAGGLAKHLQRIRNSAARGHALFTFGQPSSAVFIVVRGAVEIRARHAKRERRMAVLGPGQLLGYMSALEKGTHGSDAVAREEALLLEIPGKDFEKLYFGGSPASTKLRRAIQSTLLVSLGQTNRHLTRLISLARLRSANEETEALERLLGSQIVWTLDERAATS